VIRHRAEPQRFANSEYSTFTEYDLKRVGVRHDCVSHKDIDEARSTEPALSEELEALFARLRSAASSPTSSDPASEFVGDHSRDMPDGFSERPEQPPDFPEYARKLSVKDGCAMQFDGKDNYHQVK